MRFLVLVLLAACGAPGVVDTPAATCALTGYSPYTAEGFYVEGPAAAYPWSETFDGYAPLPALIECASAKATRAHLDVTAGCLDAVATGSAGEYTRGKVKLTNPGGAYRSLAFGFSPDSLYPVRWTDQALSFRFYSTGAGSVAGVQPGFKAFARYQSEDNLYVASWRLDGTAVIQRKQCGQYTTLGTATVTTPTPNKWHSLRFAAQGTTLTLSLDGTVAVTATDGEFPWGTAGIRIDSSDGALLDDWKVVAP